MSAPTAAGGNLTSAGPESSGGISSGGLSSMADSAGEGGDAGTLSSEGGNAGEPEQPEIDPRLDPALLKQCEQGSPIVCHLDAPDGNYDVLLDLGSDSVVGQFRVAAETRHYVGPEMSTLIGEHLITNFTVNVRAEVHDGGQSAPSGVLDLTISGDSPQLRGIGLREAPDAVTLFLAGDSTVCDWVPTNTSALRDDETGWGQALSQYFGPGVAIANYADSGETAGGFYSKFFPAARDAMKAGDYLLIQFGHNDQKNANAVDSYQDNLLRYVSDAREFDVTPILVTPASRSGASDANPGFAGLDQQMRELAAAEGVALIDLTVLSREYYATVPDKGALFVDSGTHFSQQGAEAVAGLVARAIAQSDLDLATWLKP